MTGTLQSLGVVVAILVGLIGIGGLILQLRLLQRSLETQTYQALIANSLRIDEILIGRPYLRQYVYDYVSVPSTGVDLAEVESFIELVVDVLDNLQVQRYFIPNHARAGWDQFAAQINGQPAVIDFLQKRGSWYSS